MSHNCTTPFLPVNDYFIIFLHIPTPIGSNLFLGSDLRFFVLKTPPNIQERNFIWLYNACLQFTNKPLVYTVH